MRSTRFVILLALVLISLTLNVIILVGLNSARQTVIDALGVSLDTMSGLENETLQTTIRVKQAVPVNMNVPFKQDLKVPIKLTVPVKQAVPFRDTISVPISILGQEIRVNVPISTSIPIDMNIPIDQEVPVTFNSTIPISTSMNLDMQVPVAIRIADTPLVKYLAALRTTLADIRDRLSFGQKPSGTK